jgi:aspartate/methionine/tyrosine aminotransferase
VSRQFVPFEIERMMSVWENQVEYNLSESGVHPMTTRELVQDPHLIEELLTTELNYPQANGIIELREHVAALYPGATPDNVLITTGCAQANFATIMAIMEPGDEIAIMLPNYMQIWGIAHNFGYRVTTFSLKEELAWGLDHDELTRAVSDTTKLVAIVNPNNPTGHILTGEERAAVVAAAQRSGAWLLCDEVYAGAERVAEQVTPSLWGQYERVLAMGSLSKAYGLPGLRIGWVVAPADMIQRIWAWQDYVTIGTTMLGNKLAAYALSPEVRPRILKRTRDYIQAGYRNLESWYRDQGDLLSLIPPQAAAIAFVRYHREINSTELVNHLIKAGAFVAPGDHFGLDHFLRISFGLPAAYLQAGLTRLQQVLNSVR